MKHHLIFCNGQKQLPVFAEVVEQDDVLTVLDLLFPLGVPVQKIELVSRWIEVTRKMVS